MDSSNTLAQTLQYHPGHTHYKQLFLVSLYSPILLLNQNQTLSTSLTYFNITASYGTTLWISKVNKVKLIIG